MSTAAVMSVPQVQNTSGQSYMMSAPQVQNMSGPSYSTQGFQPQTTQTQNFQPQNFTAPQSFQFQGVSGQSVPVQQTFTTQTFSNPRPSMGPGAPVIIPGPAAPIMATSTSVGYPQQQTTMVTQGFPSVTVPSALPSGVYGTGLMASIQSGRVYVPSNSSYIPPGSNLKIGMAVPYDMSVVPAFEAPLIFNAGEGVAPIAIPRNAGSVSSHASRSTSVSSSEMFAGEREAGSMGPGGADGAGADGKKTKGCCGGPKKAPKPAKKPAEKQQKNKKAKKGWCAGNEKVEKAPKAHKA